MQRRDHTELLVIHLLVGVVTSLGLSVMGGAAANAMGGCIEPLVATLCAGGIVLAVASIMAWTSLLRRVGLDFTDEPADERIVVTTAYAIAAMLAPMLADAIWGQP